MVTKFDDCLGSGADCDAIVGDDREARRQRLRLCSVVASFAGFRLEGANATRHRLGQQIIRWAAAEGANALVLPAGFMRAKSEGRDDILNAVDVLLATAMEHHIGVTVGVDACDPNWEENFPRDPAVSLGTLPYFAVTTCTRNIAPRVFRQRSTTNANWQLAPRGANAEVRLATAGRMPIALVLSGEVFSVPVRQGLGAARPWVAVVPAHWASVGCRQWSVVAHLGKLGIPVIRAAHAKAGAANVLWRGRTKLGPVIAPAPFREGMFSALAHIFDVEAPEG
jgi:hypothetical protein